MLKSISILAVTASMAAAPVFAGSPAPVDPEPFVPAAVPVSPSTPDWTGFYGGVELGYANVDTNAPGVDGDDVIGGLTVGYDYDFGNFVAGAGLDYDFADIGISPGVSLENVWRAKVRAGAKIGRGLLYGTGGYANADISTIGDDDGYFIGAGYEHLVTDNISVGGEVLFHQFDSFKGTTTDVEATTAQVRATYRF